MAASVVLRWVLAAEFALGGAVRLQPRLMPKVSEIVFSKADGFFLHLAWVPGENSQTKTQTIGVALCVAAAAFLLIDRPRIAKVATAALGGAISTTLLIGEASIAGNIWVPLLNIGAAASLLYIERKHG